MAQSPSPSAAAQPTLPALRRASASPPVGGGAATAPLSKRDKRRTMIDQRLRDIAASFSRDRDVHLRNQLNGLSRDMHYITRVDAYQYRLLDDTADDLSVELGAEGERIGLGKFATGFVNEVNDEMESRDARITDCDLAFRSQIANLQLEYEFAVQVADAEAQALKDTARARVVAGVQAKRRAIQREKEALDTADSTYLMTTHALTALATPGSPSGGPALSRKTRYTRNRQDPDGLTDGATGAVGDAVNGKRKRKAAGDLEHESPVPSGVPVGGAGGAGVHGSGVGVRGTPLAALGSALWDSKAKEADSMVAHASADRFFTARELAAANKQAHVSVAQAWTERRSEAGDSASREGSEGTGGGAGAGGTAGAVAGNGASASGGGATAAGGTASLLTGAPDNPPDDDAASALVLIAPAMDRTASHATRSTRLNPPAAPQVPTVPEPTFHVPPGGLAAEALATWDDPRRIYGLAVLEAQTIRPRGVSSKDLEAPLTREMGVQQVQEDLGVIRSLMDAPDE